ncbi:MAG: hypothetical protein RMI94_03545 [Bryobacterales bacterium]|nr:hypothetical protein [Bryobacteraceae bacterium]MDW8129598.1 hypothetical protein [Bryobacterales bacterium]
MGDRALSALLSLSESLQQELSSQPPGRVLAFDLESLQPSPAFSGAVGMLAEPDVFPSDRLFVFMHRGELHAGLPVSLGLGLHWIGESAPGKLTGRTGAPVDLGATALARISLSGSFVCVVWREAEDRVRLRVTRCRRREDSLRVRVRLETVPGPAPESDELLAALTGHHPLEAFELLLDKATRGRFDERHARLLEYWRSLEPAAAEALWRACDDAGRFVELREWLRRIAETDTEEDLAGDLAWAPPRSGWPAEAWIEAVAGNLLQAAADPETFRRLRNAARAADRLLGEDGLPEALRELKRKAVEMACERPAAGEPRALESLLATLRARALEAAGKRMEAELIWRWQTTTDRTAWLDCSFGFSEAGVAAFRKALRGDLEAALEARAASARLHAAVLTHGLRRRTHVELHLPFLDRKLWSARLEALAEARIETTLDGRIVVYKLAATDERERENFVRSTMNLCGAFILRPERNDTQFDLSWTCERRLNAPQARLELVPLLLGYGFEQAVRWLEPLLPEAEQIEMEMSVSVPGAMAAAWLEAPIERSSEFRPVYTEMSVAVQQALRTWLPFVYFRDLSRYETLGAAYPLVVYRCTLPFRSKTSNEFAYDIMSAESVALARRSTGMALAAELARIEQLLLAAGKPDTARFYRPSRRDAILASVERSPRLFHSLLVADAQFVDHLIRLGVRAGSLRRAMQHEPQRAARELARFGEEFVKTFHRRLRRLYGGEDFTAFGPLLLVEATRGLNAGLRATAAVRGVLRLTAVLRDGEVREERFVNRDYGSAPVFEA